MDIEQIKRYVKKIQVIGKENEDVEVINRSPLKMIGKGRQGAVFQISDDVCMKVYATPEDCDREHYALNLGQHTNLFPKLYKKGPNYIVMELIKGIDLREYLQSQPLTEQLSKKLIDMLMTFKEIGYERIDHHKRQIFIQRDGNLKVIDVGRTVWRDRVYPYPRKLINSLGHDYKTRFLSHVQKLAPELYDEWVHYIEMEKLASRLTRRFMEEKDHPKRLKGKTDQLLTSKESPRYGKSLEDLVYKVFEEEWAKAMVARGYDPDKIEDKIKSLIRKDNEMKKEKKKDKGKKSSKKAHSHSSPSAYRFKKKKRKK